MEKTKDGESEDLPRNWTSRIDSRYNRRYYYNKLTKQSSWTKPSPEIETVQEGVEKNRGGSRQEQKPRKSRDQDVRVDSKGDGWVSVYSKSYQRHYYYNKRSGETTWTSPFKSNREPDGDARKSKGESHRESSSRAQSSLERTVMSSATGGDSSDDEELSSRTFGHEESEEHDPELFQRKMMQQFPALKKAFAELEIGRKKLQKEREEHEARVRRELDIVNAKIEELRKLSDAIGSPGTLNGTQPAGHIDELITLDNTSSAAAAAQRVPVSVRPRTFTLEQDLRRYSVDLERRSINVVEKRKSMRTASGIRSDDLKSVIAEANRLAAERGNVPATAESAATQMERISAQFSGTLSVGSQEGEATEIQDIATEMEGVQKGLEYAMKEAEAQNEAAEEAQAAGEDHEYYKLLQVSLESTDAELKKAYRKKLIEWHPDKVRPEKRDQAVKMTDMIQNAYRVLSDPWEREIYDWFGFQQYLLHVKVLECFKNYLVAGIELIKHPRKGRPRKRVVWLDKDLTEILSFRKRVMEDQRSGKENIKGVAIKTITDVTTGRSTEVLKRTGRASHSDRYFSLVCADRTLDFECPSEESCSFIATRMKLLIIDLKRDRDWMHRHYDALEQDS